MQWELEGEGEEWREPTRTARSGRDCLGGGGVKRGSHEEQQAQGVVGDICRCFEWQEEGVVEVVVSGTKQCGFSTGEIKGKLKDFASPLNHKLYYYNWRC